jgi:hypothetical protein
VIEAILKICVVPMNVVLKAVLSLVLQNLINKSSVFLKKKEYNFDFILKHSFFTFQHDIDDWLLDNIL